MIDLVASLRAVGSDDHPNDLLLYAAAAEIERLRASLTEAVDACRYALADSPRWRETAATVVADHTDGGTR